MNPLDQVISWLSPQTAVRRQLARNTLQFISRNYTAATTGRRTSGWITGGTAANEVIRSAQTLTRERARDLVRNNPYAGRIVDVLVANVVGTGITPTFSTGDKRRDREVGLAWRAFARSADAEGQLDFGGLQALAVRSMVESGEVLPRFRARRRADGLAVPLQVQLLEADFLDVTRQRGETGNRVIDGIEFDEIGRRVGYWLYNRHPGDSMWPAMPLSSRLIPAADIVHLYRKQRPGQLRGISWLAPVVMRAQDLDTYHDAALLQAQTAACNVAFVTQPEGAGGPILGQAKADQEGQRVESLSPGQISYLRPGESVEFGMPTGAGGLSDFSIINLQAMAVGAGITYDQISGDLRQANYSSLRAGKVEFRRLVEQLQYHVLIPQFCQPVAERFWNTVSLVKGWTGEMPEITWTPPRNEPIDPLKDLQADLLAVRAGAMTLDQLIASHGYDPAQQLEDIARINKQLDAAGIVLDIDPRRASQAGLAQMQPTDQTN